MKLSDAILKGCKVIKKQARGELFEEIGENVYAACALGAAAVGAGLVTVVDITKKDLTGNPQSVFVKLRKSFPELKKRVSSLGFAVDYDDEDEDLEDFVVSLNDHHGFYRYQIARRLAAKGL